MAGPEQPVALRRGHTRGDIVPVGRHPPIAAGPSARCEHAGTAAVRCVARPANNAAAHAPPTRTTLGPLPVRLRRGRQHEPPALWVHPVPRRLRRPA